MGNENAQSRRSKEISSYSAITAHSGVQGKSRGFPNRFLRRRGMISQMSLGLGGAIQFTLSH